MARVLAQQWISADGFTAGPGGEGDVFAAVDDDAATEAHNRALLPGFGEVLLGRRTYELFAAFWPYADDQPMAATVNAMRRTVASNVLAVAPWGSHAPASVVPDAAAHVRAAAADVIVWAA
jgi:dihydrofolate reductase